VLWQIGQDCQLALHDALSLDMCSAEAVAVVGEVLLLHAIHELVKGLDLLGFIGNFGFQAWGIVSDEFVCCHSWTFASDSG
jgi:hypothetical protein